MLPPPKLGRNAILHYRRGKLIFAQGDTADSVLFLEKGDIKVSVHSRDGKEALLNIIRPGSFFGLMSLNRVPARTVSAVAITDCTVVRIGVATMRRALREDPNFSERFISYLTERSQHTHEHLANQLLNSTEQRLAWTLLQLAGSAEDQRRSIVRGVSQEMLAGMVGTTRPRISHFMNKFRRLGLIEYSPAGVVVHASLRQVALHALRVSTTAPRGWIFCTI
jgi:CRP-like cAMP-binding protein